MAVCVNVSLRWQKDVRLSKTKTDNIAVGQKRWAERMEGKKKRWATKGGWLHFNVVVEA
jgi:hypothetical protein